MPDLVIATEALTKSHGHSQAPRGLDLQVRPGAVFGCLGPNGAGKTTPIRVLLDRIRADGWTAQVPGLDARQTYGDHPVDACRRGAQPCPADPGGPLVTLTSPDDFVVGHLV